MSSYMSLVAAQEVGFFGYPEDEDRSQPRCRRCYGFLPWQPTEERRVVGYPDQEFIEVRETRPCKRCGERNEDGGWSEDIRSVDPDEAAWRSRHEPRRWCMRPTRTPSGALMECERYAGHADGCASSDFQDLPW